MSVHHGYKVKYVIFLAFYLFIIYILEVHQLYHCDIILQTFRRKTSKTFNISSFFSFFFFFLLLTKIK